MQAVDHFPKQSAPEIWSFDRTGLAREVRDLSALCPWKSLFAITMNWAVIAICFSAALTFPHPVLWITAAILIASRQHGLLILMHEAAHYRILPNRKWNDRLSNWLLAFPLLITTESYRRHHAAHHDHLNTDRDPDWMRKRHLDEWKFPKDLKGMFRILIRDLCGGGLLDNIRLMLIIRKSGRSKTQVKQAPAIWERALFYTLVAAVLLVSERWLPMLLLWVLPLFTILAVILRIRSISEHFGLAATNELNSSRNLKGTFVERFLLAPHNIGYHLDHHLYPSVPFYNLPQLHRQLMTNPRYANQAHQTRTVSGFNSDSLLMELTAGSGHARLRMR